MKWVGSGGRTSDTWGKCRVNSLLVYSWTSCLKGLVVTGGVGESIVSI